MGLEGYRLGLYEKAMPNDLSWEAKLEAAKKAGFNWVEMSVDETDEKLLRLDMDAAQRLEMLQWMSRKDIRLETMCLSGHRRFPLGSLDPQVRARSLEIMRKAIILARDLGICIIQIAGYDEYYNPSSDETRDFFAKGLERSVEIAAQYGVMLGFETMETTFLNTVQKGMRWVDTMDSPYLSVYPDSGNLTNAAVADHGNVLEDIRKGIGHISAFHLKETVPGKFREIPYGTGHVDFPGIIKLAYEMGVRRYTGEFWYTGEEDWQRLLSESNEFLSRQFQTVGIKQEK